MRQINDVERVTIVTVAYNSSDVLADMLASVPVQTPVVVFDNASKDLSQLREIVASREAKAKLIESDINLGFGTGCNKGAEGVKTEFLLFLNPDTVLFPDALQNLVQAADRHPEVSGFNPRILSEDGRLILKRRSELVARRKWLLRGDLTQDAKVPVLSGAAFFVRRDDFTAVSGFDTKIFLFFEDDDLSARLSESRGDLMYVHDAKVRHIGGASSGWSAKSENLKNWHWGFSQIYTKRKHGMQLACVGSIVKTGFRALSPATLFSSNRRKKYSARLSGMIASLRR